MICKCVVKRQIQIERIECLHGRLIKGEADASGVFLHLLNNTNPSCISKGFGE